MRQSLTATILSFTAFILTTSNVSGQDAHTTWLTQRLEAVRTKHGVPALAAALARDNSVIAEAAVYDGNACDLRDCGRKIFVYKPHLHQIVRVGTLLHTARQLKHERDEFWIRLVIPNLDV